MMHLIQTVLYGSPMRPSNWRTHPHIYGHTLTHIRTHTHTYMDTHPHIYGHTPKHIRTQPTHIRTHTDKWNRWECNHIINPVSNNFQMWGWINVICLISIEHLGIIKVKLILVVIMLIIMHHWMYDKMI